MKVLITGTSRGIGLEIACKFLKEGHEVIGIDVDPCGIVHDNYTHFQRSITDEFLPAVDNVEILINNAGVQFSYSYSKDVIDINLKGTINVTNHYAHNPRIKSVLFIGSASARNGSEFPMYVASKAGMVGFMKQQAMELGKYYIATVNSISPGGVFTPINSHITNDVGKLNEVLSETLLDRWAHPAEVADLAYYLTVINRSITGEDILMDNGEQLKSNFIW